MCIVGKRRSQFINLDISRFAGCSIVPFETGFLGFSALNQSSGILIAGSGLANQNDNGSLVALPVKKAYVVLVALLP